MALNLYRRHAQACTAGRPRYFCSGEFEERKKGWKRCTCVIFASGTLGGRFRRRGTEKVEWEDAKAVATAWEAAGSWELDTAAVGALTPPSTASPSPAARWVAEPEPEPPTPVLKLRTTIVEAAQAFLTNRETKQVAPATLRKYVTFIKQLRAFADTRGYLLIDQFTTSDIDLFYARLKMGARAKGKRLGTLRAFFRFCVNRKWIDETPVSVDLKAPIGSSKAADKMPFSDDEIARIIAACDKPPCPPRGRNSSPVATGTFVGAVWKNDQGNGAWTGEDLKDIIWLMIYTGYRISDAVFFDMNRLRGNQVMIRAQKNGKQVFGVLPDWIRDRLLARAKVHGSRPFIVGRSRRLESLTNVWRRRIARAFAAAGEFEQTPTPHRFRHTFARILLEKGVSVADVAELMGDDEETVRISYSAWVPERQNRLTAIL